MTAEGRRQVVGPRPVEASLERGDSLRLLLVREGNLTAASRAVLERCRAAGVAIRVAGGREMKRLSSEPDAEMVAFVGPDPAMPLDELLHTGGALWLLAGVGYPGNAGFAIRTAEVSGADGILIDAAFDHAGRRQALRTAMRADRFLPLHWVRAGDAIDRARSAGRRLVGIEDTGHAAPWDADLRGPLLLLIGGEAGGLDPALQARCDETIRIPMPGFIPSYNLQAAMAMVAGERLRQLA